MSTTSSDDRRFPPWLVQNRNFVLLWAGYGIAAIGDHLSEMALLVERGALDTERSVRISALLSFGFFLPFVIFGPIAGWWADRFSRKVTMIIADVVRAGIVIGFVWAVPALSHAFGEGASGDYSIMLAVMALGLLAVFFSPARQAMLPTLIRPNQLVRANAMTSALGTIGGVLGYTIGGLIVAGAEAEHATPEFIRNAVTLNYVLDAGTYIASAILVLLIFVPRASRITAPPAEAGVWQPLIEGFRYVGGHQRVWQMILLGSLFWGAAGIVIACVPDIVKEVFGGGYADIGVYRGIIIIGLAVGAAVLTVLGPALSLPLAVMIGLAGATFWLALLDVAYIFKLGRLLTGICLFGIGGAGAILLVTVISTIQRFVPNSRRGRVFGVSDTCTMGAMVLTSGLLGLPNIPHLDRYVPYLIGVCGLGFLVACAHGWRIYRRHDPHPTALSAVWYFVELYGRFWCGVKRDGACTIPQTGPVILACNHTSGVDPMAVYASYRHRIISFVVERKYYRAPLFGWFMRLVDCVPIDRDAPTPSSLRRCLRILHVGGCIGIFPQGTYVGAGEPDPPAKPGVGVLALRSGAMVIPCHISGARHADSPWLAYLLRHKMRIRYGRPVDLSDLGGDRRDPAAARAASERIMAAIDALAPTD